MNKKIESPTEGIIKFENKEKTRSWFKDNFKKRVLFSDEKKIFDEYTHPESKIKKIFNNYLKETGGELVNKEHPRYDSLSQKYNVEKINESIEILNRAIWRNQIYDSMYVYEFTNESRLGLTVNSLRDQNNDISIEKIEDLRKNWKGKIIKKRSFLEVSFDENETHFLPIMFEYIAEKGTHGAYFDREDHNEPKMLFCHNQLIKIEEIKLVEDKQAQNATVVKIQAVLIGSQHDAMK